MKILRADDDNVSRLVLASALKKQGHEVVAAENGLKALASRIHVAERTIGLQRRVAEAARELREKNEQLEEDLKMGHELQMALLPQHFPSIPRSASPTESAIKFRASTIRWRRSVGIFSLSTVCQTPL